MVTKQKKPEKKSQRPQSAPSDKEKKLSTVRKLNKTETVASGNIEYLIPLAKLRFDPDQPRTDFHTLDGRIQQKDEAYIVGLAQAIKENELVHPGKGLQQPITVRPDLHSDSEAYIVVWGECRTRAHILLGMTHIRAFIRTDLEDPAIRLLEQISENVNRKELSEADLAKSIRRLKEGDKARGIHPLKQFEIAKKLGMSQGWVTRNLQFGEEDLQRIWIETGIVDSVEKLYRISTLAPDIQASIVRRTELPEDHPDFLAKPLNRKFVDEIYGAKKARKKLASQLEQAPRDYPPTNVEETLVVAQENIASYNAGTAKQKKKYTRMELSPVHCRATLANTLAFYDFISEDKNARGSLAKINCDLIIPGEVAQEIANRIAGHMVDERELVAIIQSKLSISK